MASIEFSEIELVLDDCCLSRQDVTALAAGLSLLSGSPAKITLSLDKYDIILMSDRKYILTPKLPSIHDGKGYCRKLFRLFL